jgi:hypothetical protein
MYNSVSVLGEITMTATALSGFPTKEQFSQQVHQPFSGTAPNGSDVEMTLAKFTDIFDSDTQETFTLVFRAPADTAAEQGTYVLRNQGFGEQAIFLVPVGQDENGVLFEAVYNRLKSGVTT